MDKIYTGYLKITSISDLGKLNGIYDSMMATVAVQTWATDEEREEEFRKVLAMSIEEFIAYAMNIWDTQPRVNAWGEYAPSIDIDETTGSWWWGTRTGGNSIEVSSDGKVTWETRSHSPWGEGTSWETALQMGFTYCGGRLMEEPYEEYNNPTDVKIESMSRNRVA